MRNQGGSREFRGFTVVPWLSDVCYLEGWGEGGDGKTSQQVPFLLGILV